MNFTSLSFVASSALIPYPYLLAIAAHSFSVGAMVVGIRVGGCRFKEVGVEV